MGDIEIVIGPFFKPIIIICAMRIARLLQPCVKRLAILGIGQRRVKICPAPKPAFLRDQKARIHVDSRHMGVGHMRNQADARCKEIGIIARAVDRLCKIF